jgi:hypothetical protein
LLLARPLLAASDSSTPKDALAKNLPLWKVGRAQRSVEYSTVDALSTVTLSSSDGGSSARMLSSMDSMIIEFTDVKTAQAQKISALEEEIRALKLQLQHDGEAEPQPSLADCEPEPQA